MVLIGADALGAGLPVIQLLTLTGITASGKEAKRLIAEGGLRLNNDLVSDPQTPVDAGVIGDGLKVSVGKKKHRMVRIG